MHIPRVALILLSVVAGIARGQPRRESIVDPDTELGRRHFVAGTAFYNDQRYEDAIREFEAAKLVKPLAAFDFNIGRCYDRLGRADLAIVGYQRYVDAVPTSADADEVRARIALLRTRLAQAPAPANNRTSLRPAALVVGAVAVAMAAVATGLYLSAYSDYQTEHVSCGHQCSPDQIASFFGSVQTRVDTSYALFSVAAVAAVADIALWVVDGRSRRADRRAWIAPAGLGVAVAGRF